MDSYMSELVGSVYSSNYDNDSNFSLEKWLNCSDTRYYSFARHSLRDALKILKIQKGDLVALPEFICRDLISAISSSGATTIFYPVDKSLNLLTVPNDLYKAKAIIVVNYFGFPQDLNKFKSIVEKSHAVLIEDNAHGFLSCDQKGHILGTRTPLSIFSLRKTIPLFNGAVMVVNDVALSNNMPEQLAVDYSKVPLKIEIKKLLRLFVRFVGVWPCRLMTLLTRVVRKVRTGSKIPISDINMEIKMPGKPNPYFKLSKELSKLNITKEVSRRRELYQYLDKSLKKYGVEPIFDKLIDGVSPYGFPFRVNNKQIVAVKRFLKNIKLECNQWPELPSEIVSDAKPYYKNVWMVPFLW